MAIYSLYAGTDGESHIEELVWEQHPELATQEAPLGVFLRKRGPEHQDFHQAPERRWLIVLSGHIEMGLADGTTHRFGAGDAIRVTDTTGHGHTTTWVDDPIYAVVTLP